MYIYIYMHMFLHIYMNVYFHKCISIHTHIAVYIYIYSIHLVWVSRDGRISGVGFLFPSCRCWVLDFGSGVSSFGFMESHFEFLVSSVGLRFQVLSFGSRVSDPHIVRRRRTGSSSCDWHSAILGLCGVRVFCYSWDFVVFGCSAILETLWYSGILVFWYSSILVFW